MRRAGRFLWLDWAQAQVETAERASDESWKRLAAFHDGYRDLGLRHRRQVTAYSDGRWEIRDELLPEAGASLAGEVSARLHWLLPDWPWQFEPGSEEYAFRLASPHSEVRITIRAGSVPEISADSPQGILPQDAFHQPASNRQPKLQVQFVRAGELLVEEPLTGPGPIHPTWGWTSPTYGVKIPALSLSACLFAPPPLTFTTHFYLPNP
jgi:hypothetical protein